MTGGLVGEAAAAARRWILRRDTGKLSRLANGKLNRHWNQQVGQHLRSGESSVAIPLVPNDQAGDRVGASEVHDCLARVSISCILARRSATGSLFGGGASFSGSNNGAGAGRERRSSRGPGELAPPPHVGRSNSKSTSGTSRSSPAGAFITPSQMRNFGSLAAVPVWQLDTSEPGVLMGAAARVQRWRSTQSVRADRPYLCDAQRPRRPARAGAEMPYYQVVLHATCS